MVSEDNESYSMAATELGLSHQLSIAHVRKYPKRRSKSILEQAEAEWGEGDQKYEKLEEDLGRLRGLLEELPEDGERRIGRLHREYLWAEPPTRDSSSSGGGGGGGGGRKDPKKKGKKEKASAGYRMRMLTLELWQKYKKIRLHLRGPESGLDGTNNASERSIGKSKVRYKSMRGYESEEGMNNGIAPTQWLYDGEEDEHDLAKEMAA